VEAALRLIEDETPEDAYPIVLNERLKPPSGGSPLVIDLFAGCGGLALGFEAAGFVTRGYEMEPDYAETYRRNLSGECLTEVLTEDTEFPDAPVIIGGPPCQPFSVGGWQRGVDDSRNGFPAFLSAVRRKRPALALIENVRGMLCRKSPGRPRSGSHRSRTT
jgi:DNA (cytosine-5)-methyltransferase 1